MQMIALNVARPAVKGRIPLCRSPTTKYIGAGITKQERRSGQMAAYPYDLGVHSLQVTTQSTEAQVWFDRGLNWTYAFNHDEPIKCFEKAMEANPNCAMAYWGKVYALGPNIDLHWGLLKDDAIAQKPRACVRDDRTGPCPARSGQPSRAGTDRDAQVALSGS